MPERPSVCRKASMSLSEFDIFVCSLCILEVNAASLQVRKIPLKHRGTIAYRCNTSQIPFHSPAEDLLHRYAWCGADCLYSFNIPFYFPRAWILFSRQHIKVFLSHRLLLRDLSLNAGFGAICGISHYLFSIATGPLNTELAIRHSVFLSALQNEMVYLVNTLISNLKLC